MDDNAEEGIMRAQAAAARARGADRHHGWNIAYLDERIVVFLLAIAIIGLVALWATTTSRLVLYGSLAGVILLVILWGFARVRRLDATRRERALQAEAWRSQNRHSSGD